MRCASCEYCMIINDIRIDGPLPSREMLFIAFNRCIGWVPCLLSTLSSPSSTPLLTAYVLFLNKASTFGTNLTHPLCSDLTITRLCPKAHLGSAALAVVANILGTLSRPSAVCIALKSFRIPRAAPSASSLSAYRFLPGFGSWVFSCSLVWHLLSETLTESVPSGNRSLPSFSAVAL